jgi:hypothetical protein
MQSEVEFENYKKHYDPSNSNFATFYGKGRHHDNEIEDHLMDFEDRMQRRNHGSVMANLDKVERAREVTEKLRMKQAEHEEIEKKRREEVFTDYMQRRLKAEEKVVS